MRIYQGQCICQSVCSTAYQSSVFQLLPVDGGGGGRGDVKPSLDLTLQTCLLFLSRVLLESASPSAPLSPVGNLEVSFDTPSPRPPSRWARTFAHLLNGPLKTFEDPHYPPISLSKTCIIHPSLKQVPWCID